MKSNVYVLQFVPLQHDPQNAFVTVELAGFPDAERHTIAASTGVDVSFRQASAGTVDAILSGTSRSILEAAEQWPETCADWRQTLREALKRTGSGRPDKPLKVGKWLLPWHERTLMMGILNVTPDSFSDGGIYNTVDAAVQQARELVEAGADIIDIGGESTRPAGVYGEGAAFVSAEEERERVLPVISRLAVEVDVPISIDTYKAEVAEAAIASGAHIVNDVWGLKRDPHMAEVVARCDVPVIIMHNRERIDYRDSFIREVIDDLWHSVALAHAAGVRDDRIILDPGVGFAKTHAHNLALMHHLEQIAYMGYPLLLGTSRKSLVGKTLELPVDQRVEGTGATVAFGIAKGCHIVRVHDVKEMVRVCRMTDALTHPHPQSEVV